MAEPAIDPQARDVMLMAERHWLGHREAGMARPIGAWRQPPPRDPRPKENPEPEQYDPTNQRCLRWENRRHQFNRILTRDGRMTPDVS
jgi:hypothetical protein